MVKEIDVNRCFRRLVLSGAGASALLATACNIGVSAPLLNPDGSPAPRTYCPRGTYVPADGLIDDFEDGNRQIASVGGRSQYWYTSADSEGSEIFPEEFEGLTLDPRTSPFYGISRQYLRSRIGLFGILPALLAVVLLWNAVGLAALLALLWIPVCALVSWQKYRRYGLMYGRDGLALRSGLIGYRVIAWLHRKVQRISVTQSPFQRRKQLATLRIHLAAGSPVKIPYIDVATANSLRDFVLYRVESSDLSWH